MDVSYIQIKAGGEVILKVYPVSHSRAHILGFDTKSLKTGQRR